MRSTSTTAISSTATTCSPTRSRRSSTSPPSRIGENRYIWQTSSSNDDEVHSATLRDSRTFAMLGCLVYRESTEAFSYFPATGDFDECQVDKSGDWLLIKENVDGVAGEDNRIIDLRPSRFVFLDQQGAAGHSDNGYGYMVALDNWSPVPGAVRVWTFGVAMPGPPPQGRLVYRTTDWCARHRTHLARQCAARRADRGAIRVRSAGDALRGPARQRGRVFPPRRLVAGAGGRAHDDRSRRSGWRNQRLRQAPEGEPRHHRPLLHLVEQCRRQLGSTPLSSRCPPDSSGGGPSMRRRPSRR